MRRLKRVLQIGCGLLLALVILGVLGVWYHFHQAPRRWKTQALADLNRWYVDRAWQDAQRAQVALPPGTTTASSGWWGNEHFMLMQNGEWLVYTHSNSHESPAINDHFIAHASNGKWYYTTFHFCKDMVGLGMEYPDQPTCLAQFVYQCSLEEFDGHSDACLKRTEMGLNRSWPPPGTPTAVAPASVIPASLAAPLPPESAHAP